MQGGSQRRHLTGRFPHAADCAAGDELGTAFAPEAHRDLLRDVVVVVLPGGRF